MKTQNYFVFAVMIAIIVPVAMGSIYFISMYNKVGTQKYITDAALKNEVLVLGDIELDSLQGIKKGPIVSELVVKYTYGESEVSDYNLYLDDVHLSKNIDPKLVKWELYMLNLEDNKYLQLKFGDMGDLKNGKLNISPNLQIGKNHTQRFRLNYYLNSEEENNEKIEFYAKVILE